MTKRLIALTLFTAGLAGCSGGQSDRPAPERRAPEFAGRTIRVEAANGQTSQLHFRRNGTVEARFGERATQGRWALERRKLCFTWAQNFRECWPYKAPFQRGRTVSITSDRGNVVKATLQ